MIAGMIMPPSAPATGRMAFCTVDRCPDTISRLISRPTEKKKIIISPSFTNFSTLKCRSNLPTFTPTGASSRSW